jgi:hypothetical protein
MKPCDPLVPMAGAGPLLLGCFAFLPFFLAGPAWAGSVTAESVMDQQNAQQRALEKVPRGATVTRTECQEVSVTGNYRYRCSVWYDEAPPETDTPPQTP